MALHYQSFQPGHLSPILFNSAMGQLTPQYISIIHHGGILTPMFFTLVDVSPLSLIHQCWNCPPTLSHHGTQFTTKYTPPLWIFTMDQNTILKSFRLQDGNCICIV